MPLFRVQLRKAFEGASVSSYKWSNVFFIEEASVQAAASMGAGLWTGYLRNTCRINVYAYEVAASDLTPGTEIFVTLPVDPEQQRGTRPIIGGGTEVYHPRVCVTVTAQVQNSRPSRKFWRPGLTEADVIRGEILDPVTEEAIREQFNNAITQGVPLRVPDGQAWLPGVTLRLSTRVLGRYARNEVPAAPAVAP